jgi:hypothetical protein
VSLWLVRRAGRERLLVGAGGPADAAFGAPAGPAGQAGQAGQIETRIDEADLADMATTDFAPPEGMTASQGGIVLAEEARPEHRVAWLLEAAIEGSIELVPEGGSLTMIRRAPGSAWTAAVLDQIFSGRERVPLGAYDLSFAIGWGRLTSLLYGWRSSSGLWDERAGQRSGQGRIDDLLTTAIALVFGVLGAAGGGVLVHRWAPLGLLLAAAGGAALSAGVARFTARWELRVRTPAGSAAWLRVESFRRFLAESEAYHAEDAAKRGVLREYTAWAGFAWMAPVLRDSAERTRTEPPRSSSSGFGGFGGSSGRRGGHRGRGRVGSGAGGGGGGSW